MLTGLSEAEARKKILALAAEYCDLFHAPKAYQSGDRLAYAGRVYDRAELTNLVDSALDFWLTAGRYADLLEERLAAWLGLKHCFLVNSGSSANLLAFMALTSPLLEERAIRPGDEIITVGAGFPTTVAPMVQYGAIPVMVDVTIPQYNLDVSALEQALSGRSKAVMVAHTLGNPFDLGRVKEFCEANGLWLIEDNCDALGSTYRLDGADRLTGTFGHIGTSSFYPPHHITLGEGGAVYTNDDLLAKIVLSMRDWGRDCRCKPGQDNLCGRRFSGVYGQLPPGYDHKYVFSHFGYNLKVTDMQAAIGLAQLDKLPGFIERRRHNFERLHASLADLTDRLILPEACPGSRPSWFGFALTCRAGLSRSAVVRRLEEKGLQTRMLFAGNLLQQPCFDQMRRGGYGYRTVGDLPNTDRIMRDTFWVGVYPGLNDQMIDDMAVMIGEAVR